MVIYRPSTELRIDQLNDMALDGLLEKVGPDCWLASGTRLCPNVRAHILGRAPMCNVIYSHECAHWVWWGASFAPVVRVFTTKYRRRVHIQEPLIRVFERTIPAEEFVEFDDPAIAATLPSRTIYDLLADIVHPQSGQRSKKAQLRKATGFLTALNPAELEDAHEFIHRQTRKPRINQIKELFTLAAARA